MPPFYFNPMKKTVLIGLALVMLLAQCRRRNNDPTPTELLAREWRVARALINGQVDNQGSYANFRLRFVARPPAQPHPWQRGQLATG
jgi:hypothetical protein